MFGRLSTCSHILELHWNDQSLLPQPLKRQRGDLFRNSTPSFTLSYKAPAILGLFGQNYCAGKTRSSYCQTLLSIIGSI